MTPHEKNRLVVLMEQTPYTKGEEFVVIENTYWVTKTKILCEGVETCVVLSSMADSMVQNLNDAYKMGVIKSMALLEVGVK